MLSISSSALPDNATVVAFDGHEALCRPYRYDVYVGVPDASALDRADAIGAKATLSIDRTKGGPVPVHGVIASVSLLHTFGDGGIFRVAIVPRLWLLSQGRYSRMFTKQTVPQILQQVLSDEGLSGGDVDVRLRGSYDPEEHVCQYRESHLDFLHRWMELEGIYYFFEQGDKAEKLVITDDASSHTDLLGHPVGFSLGSHAGALTDAIDAFSTQRRSRPQGVKLHDYDYLRPQLDLSARADVSPTGSGEVNHHAARYFTPAKAKAMAKVRADELLCREVQHHALSSSFGLRPGFLFELENHPSAKLNAKYLVTEARIHGRDGRTAQGTLRHLGVVDLGGESTFQVRATCIDSTQQFRPRRATIWPRVHGFENGVIDGPANSEYAQIDDHGRYLVKFRFDDSALKDGEASTYVRMLQPHGGTVEGWHFPLRKGTEVLFQFLTGDPDRPVIAGMVPHPLTPSPVTSKNHTVNVVQTGGLNRLEMEDKEGTQRFSLSTPLESTMLRLGDPNDDCNAKATTTGVGRINEDGNFTMLTHGAKHEEAQNTVDENFHGPFKTTVQLATTEIYLADKDEEVVEPLDQHYLTSQTTGVIDHVDETFHQKHATTVTGARVENLDADVKHTFNTTRATTVTNHVTDTYSAGYDLSVTGPMTHKVSGKYVRQAGNIDDKILLNHNVWTASASLTVAIQSETYVKKSEIHVGAKFEIISFLKVEATCAILVEKSAISCELWGDEANTSAAKSEEGEAHAETGAAETTNAAAHVKDETVSSEA